MRKIILILILLDCYTVASCQEWKQYAENFEFIISFPENWTLDDSETNGTSVILSSEPESATDLFKENVNILILDLSGQNIDMDKFLELSKKQIKTLNPNDLYIDRSFNSRDGFPESIITYSFKNGNFRIKTKQRIKMKNEKAYIVTYIAQEEKYDIFYSIADRILNSFSLEKRIPKTDPSIFENLQHKLSVNVLDGFEYLETEGDYLLHQGDFSDDNYKSYSIKYNDDWRFKLLSTKTYSEEVISEEKLKKMLSIIYRDVSINAIEISKKKSDEDYIHFLYSGVEEDTEVRMTIASFQYIKNYKLYTLNCQCKSTYFQYYYQDCLKLFQSMKIK